MKDKPLLAALLILAAQAQTWQTAQRGFHFVFPRDHFDHPAFETEWWYYTGNLRAENGHRYGFELTFFRQANALTASAGSESTVWQPAQVYLAHFAVSDIHGKSFFHTDRLNRAGPGLAGAGLPDARYWNGNWDVRWTSLPGSQQLLRAVSGHFALELQLDSMKAPVIQGRDGVSVKGPQRGQASHYVSLTRLRANGKLSKDDVPLKVQGLAWMDHEFFTESAESDLVGWDWFAVQLDDNEELMLYRLRRKDGAPDDFSSGSYVASNGSSQYLGPGDFVLTPQEHAWTSKNSGAKYPISWHISVPKLDLELVASTELENQELWSSNSITPPYWEGAMNFKGSARGKEVTGVGYLEMTGYAGPVRLSGAAPK